MAQLYSTISKLGTGTLWTTGAVSVIARAGAFPTSLHRTGYDNRTGMRRGNIQLVTPGLTHWLSPRYDMHTAHIGILKIQVPEPHAVPLLATAAGVLVVLRSMSRRG